jgi:hypothetical protein
MAMPDLRALQEMLRLWDIYRRGGAMPWGFAPWKTLFELLRDVRAWGPTDRVPPETLDYWRQRIEARPEEPVRFEVELWFHQRADRRTSAAQEIRGQVTALGGRVVSTAAIEPIRYHGMLVDLPPQRVTELLEHPNVTLARLDSIMYLRPHSVAVFPDSEGVRRRACYVRSREHAARPADRCTSRWSTARQSRKARAADHPRRS